MLDIIRTDSENPDFHKLVLDLDALLRVLDGEDHLFYSQLNKTDSIKHVVIAYENNNAVGCGAIREYSEQETEIKRMYVPENFRGKGIASKILIELENWAKELHYQKCILETGFKQIEAIHLYKKSGYKVIENFGKYKNIENSICFEKILL